MAGRLPRGRANWTGGKGPAWRSRECVDCGARPGRLCYSLPSWVPDAEHRDGGFFTRTLTTPHRSRYDSPATAAASPRTVLRMRIGALAQRKLAGADRVQCRRWAGSTKRTEQELSAKVAELEPMADLAW
jgi:hypothetical protein